MAGLSTSSESHFHAGISPDANHVAVQELQREFRLAVSLLNCNSLGPVDFLVVFLVWRDRKESFEELEVIGQFNLGFIIAKLDCNLFIVDQV